ncbi:MAG TPA: hypothetical protein VHD36_24385 [Pirellulales bacterium]|nr:hypothetical protein [Pirellulales bacterium]HWA98186.1 hypothetical protein [Pirellulales bacterium]
MANTHPDIIATLERAIDRAKPPGVELSFHPIYSELADGSWFTTVHVVTTDGGAVDSEFDFAGIARELGEKAHPKIEDRKVYSQSQPLPYKVITGAQDNQPFEILFLLDAPASCS